LYIKLKNGKFVYLSAITDSFTNEILAYKMSKTFDVQFVLDTVKDLKEKHGKTFNPNDEILLHSDQGYPDTVSNPDTFMKYAF
jgi:transposase InsO family protein